MFNKQQFFIGLALLILFTFCIGFFVGRSTKECPKVLVENVKSDTTDSYLPLTGGAGSPITIITYPKNDLLAFNAKKIALNANDITDKSNSDTCRTQNVIGFVSTDTLRYDSLFVAITDTGDCGGIISRHSVFGGKFKAQTITNTITKVIEMPDPLFQLNAGVQTSFIGKWNSVDVGPAIQLQLKQKYSLGYGYMIGTSSHNISILTKIK